jgi:transcriptional regulator with XRE-family HTH domain
VSQRDLAEALGVSQSVVSLWEKGSTTPSFDLLAKLGRNLKVDVDTLIAARARTEARNAAAPRTVDYILYQADEFLRGHDATIWVCGPDQLPVLEDSGTQRKWLENLQDGVCYHLLWVLDRVEPAEFKAALPHFAQIADNARTLRDEGRRETPAGQADNWGSICFHAVTATHHDAATIDTYNAFCDALGNEHEMDDLLALKPYVCPEPQAEDSSARSHQRARLSGAIEDLLRIWHPETSMILYQPDSMKTPPIANIRMMPVSEEIYTLGGKPERPMYWLSPLGAAHFSHVIETIAGALEVLQRKPEISGGDRQ